MIALKIRKKFPRLFLVFVDRWRNPGYDEEKIAGMTETALRI